VFDLKVGIAKMARRCQQVFVALGFLFILQGRGICEPHSSAEEYARNKYIEDLHRSLLRSRSEFTPLLVAFKNCYEKSADRLSQSQESAETVVVASFAACAKEEGDMKSYLLKELKNVQQVDRVMQTTRTTAREQLLLRIINRRLESKPP
jgi:hypothetical protein